MKKKILYICYVLLLVGVIVLGIIERPVGKITSENFKQLVNVEADIFSEAVDATTELKQLNKFKNLDYEPGNKKITIYLFHGLGCGHCFEFTAYLTELYEKYGDSFDVVAYESFYDDANLNLLKKVAKEYGFEYEGVPVIFIGSNYFVGYDSSLNSTYEQTLTTYIDGEAYVDKIAPIVDKVKNKEARAKYYFIYYIVGGILLGVGLFLIYDKLIKR